jgi:hypothetical protein
MLAFPMQPILIPDSTVGATGRDGWGILGIIEQLTCTV